MKKDKNMTPFNAKGEPHGYWERYWGNGELFFKCIYHNGKEIGYDEQYSISHKLTKRFNL